ncbi:MAG TPA: glutathione S-transferase domain-containing protein, partial [Pseudomonadales bacterium]
LPLILSDIEKHVEAINDWLSGGNWLVGNNITLADIAVYSQLQCINQTPEGSQIIGKKPAVTAWLERVATSTEKQAAIAA